MARPIKLGGEVRADWPTDPALLEYLAAVSRLVGQRIIVATSVDPNLLPATRKGTIRLSLWTPAVEPVGTRETLVAIDSFPVGQPVIFCHPPSVDSVSSRGLRDMVRLDMGSHRPYAFLYKGQAIVSLFPLWPMTDRLRLSLIVALLTTALTAGQLPELRAKLKALAEPSRLFLVARALALVRAQTSTTQSRQLDTEQRQLETDRHNVADNVCQAQFRLARANLAAAACRPVSLRSLRQEARRQYREIMVDRRVRLVTLTNKELCWVTTQFATDPLPDGTRRLLGPYWITVDVATGRVTVKLLWSDGERMAPSSPHPRCRQGNTLSLHQLAGPVGEAVATQALDRVVRLITEYLTMIDPTDTLLMGKFQAWPIQEGGTGS